MNPRSALRVYEDCITNAVKRRKRKRSRKLNHRFQSNLNRHGTAKPCQAKPIEDSRLSVWLFLPRLDCAVASLKSVERTRHIYTLHSAHARTCEGPLAQQWWSASECSTPAFLQMATREQRIDQRAQRQRESADAVRQMSPCVLLAWSGMRACEKGHQSIVRHDLAHL
jgi:hypothetical protein